MTDQAESLLFGLSIIGVLLSLLLWGMALDRVVRCGTLIPWSPRRTVPWTILEVVAIVFIGLCLLQAATLLVAKVLQVRTRDLVDPDAGAEYQLPLLIGFACSSMLTWLISLLLLRLRSGATSSDLGYRPLRLGTDLILALGAFVMLIVPMLTIQYLAMKAFPMDERHPFIDLIVESPDLRAFVPIALAAVVVAPVVEEFMFRVLLQSWLERVFGGLARATARDDQTDLISPLAASTDTNGVEDEPNPFEAPPPQAPLPHFEDASSGVGDEPTRTAWAPIIISGLLFSLAHVGHGPAPLALLFLGIGLGYLFQRTHRILPCMIVHALVNLLAVAQLGLYISQQSAR